MNTAKKKNNLSITLSKVFNSRVLDIHCLSAYAYGLGKGGGVIGLV